MSNTEKAYWTHEVADKLGISDSTVRKWCLELEKNGYEFIKGANDSRAFTEHDFSALKKFQILMKENRLTKEQASLVVSQEFKREGNEGTTPMQLLPSDPPTQAMTEMIKQLAERLDKQESQLAEQQRYIENSLSKRDEQLMKAIREMSETRKQLALAQAEQEANKKKWYQFWK